MIKNFTSNTNFLNQCKDDYLQLEHKILLLNKSKENTLLKMFNYAGLTVGAYFTFKNDKNIYKMHSPFYFELLKKDGQRNMITARRRMTIYLFDDIEKISSSFEELKK